MRRARRSGYTLIELMVVVSILGVLISLALPAFRNYVMRVRAAEAPSFMGEIRLREEAYRAEFYQYLSTESAWEPTVIPPNGELGDFAPAAGSPWIALGALPDGPVRFRYRIATGIPGNPPLGGAITGLDGSDFAFVMQAEADLDGDGVPMGVEGYSESSVYYYSSGGAGTSVALPSGWN